MRYVGWLVAGIILIVGYLYCPSPTVVQQPGRIDTVYVGKPMPIAVIDTAAATKPAKVVVHTADTAARTKAEKQDIITAVEVNRNLVVVEKLDPRGIGIRQEYKLPELAAVKIDGNGQAQISPDRQAKRRKFLRKVGIVAAGAGGFVLGLVL